MVLSVSENNELTTSGIWTEGPDVLMPANSLYSNSLNTPVKLRTKENDLQKYPPMSFYTMFKKAVDADPDHNALAYKSNGQWFYFSYLEYWKMSIKSAKSLIKLGLEMSECITICGFNAPQWFLANNGAVLAGGVSCGIYPTNTEETNEHIFKDCKCKIVIVENKAQLDKVVKIIDKGQVEIKTIIQYSGEVDNDYNGLVISWQKFIELGIDVSDETFNDRVRQTAPNKCSTLIYTSGTTGPPKAAMISHDCLGYLVRNIASDQAKLKFGQEKFISYLPLSHIAAQSVDIYASIYVRGTTYFAQPDAMKGSLAITMQEVKPTFFFGVPRVWEKFQDKIESTLKTFTGVKAKLINWARKVSFDYWTNYFIGQSRNFSLSYSIARIILGVIHKKMGLEKCQNFLSAAAPITKETLDFFISIGFPMAECYGMSETTGPHSIGTSWSNRVTSVGAIDQFNRSKIVNKSDDDSGELCIYGRHVFMGYLNNPTKTEETFGSDDWLHTGDIGKIDCDGFLYITGRLKELIITAGGENIAPIPIEDKIKSELPRAISNCMLVGDKKKYLVILVTLKSKINLDTLEPKDELTDDCIEWLKSIGSNSTKVSDIVDNKDPLVYQQIEKGVKAANEASASRAAKVQKFTILPRDFSLFNGELGPTLKLRRPIVSKMYTSTIDDLYSDE